MTTLTITPEVAKKRLKLSGTVAAGEKVSVTVVGFGLVSTENLQLRAMSGNVAVGVFPLENEDEWTVSGSDLTCTLNLATEQAERICRFFAEVCFVLEDTGTPQLYGTSGFTLNPWIKLAGVDVPVNLDNYKVKYAELCVEIDGLRTEIEKKYEKPSGGIPKTDLAPAVRTSLDKADAVTLKVPKSAFDELLGLSLPDSATQKDTRQMVQRILSVLQNAAVCIALAFALPALGIDADTAWEDVPPQSTVKSVVEQFAPQTGQKVESVNGKTGTVALAAKDVKALASTGGVVRLDVKGDGGLEVRYNGATLGAWPSYSFLGPTYLYLSGMLGFGLEIDGSGTFRKSGGAPDGGATFSLPSVYEGSYTFAMTSDIPSTDGFLTEESDPTVYDWAKASSKPQYGWNEITGKPDIATRNDATNAAEAVVREKSLGGIWDKQLEVWWTPVMINGGLTYLATTNVDLNAGN